MVAADDGADRAQPARVWNLRREPYAFGWETPAVEHDLSVTPERGAVPAEPGRVGQWEVLAEKLLAAFGAVERGAVDHAGTRRDIARFVQLDEVVQIVRPETSC